MNSSGQKLASGQRLKIRNYNDQEYSVERKKISRRPRNAWIKSLYQVKTCSINFKTQQMDPHSSCTHPNGQWFRQLAVHMGGVCYACGRVKVKYRNLFCYNHSRRISSFLVKTIGSFYIKWSKWFYSFNQKTNTYFVPLYNLFQGPLHLHISHFVSLA